MIYILITASSTWDLWASITISQHILLSKMSLSSFSQKYLATQNILLIFLELNHLKVIDLPKHLRLWIRVISRREIQTYVARLIWQHIWKSVLEMHAPNIIIITIILLKTNLRQWWPCQGLIEVLIQALDQTPACPYKNKTRSLQN